MQIGYLNNHNDQSIGCLKPCKERSYRGRLHFRRRKVSDYSIHLKINETCLSANIQQGAPFMDTNSKLEFTASGRWSA